MSLKIRRLADDRVPGNILIAKIAEAGGLKCPPSSCLVTLTANPPNYKYASCRISNGETYVEVFRNLRIQSNVNGFNFEAAYKMLKRAKTYIEKVEIVEEDWYSI